MAKNDTNNNDMNPFVEESIRILHEAHVSKKLVLFVGAGVDKPSGLPLWSEATKKFKDCLHLEDDDFDNLRLPQYYYNSRGKKEYVELCRDIFLYEKELPINEIHKEIVSFKVNTIITTNYTNFLEREMKSRGYIYRVISQDKDLPYAKNENLIIKMHGDFEHDNFVLKEDDYLRYSDNFRLIETYIKSIIAKNVVLFIGYSFNDPDVKQLFSWVKDILGSDFQNAYMLEGYAEYDKNVFEYYKNLGVNVIYTKTVEGNEQNDLLKMLSRIRVGDKGNLSNVDTMINYFTPYQELNYILSRYINRGIRQCNLLVENGALKSLSEKKENEANKLLSELIDQATGKMLSSSEKYDTIIGMFQKSGVEAIEIINWKGTAGERQYFEIQHIENDLFNMILEFDYDELKKNVENGDLSNSEDGQFHLQQAYIYYILEEYQKAYKALCIAAELLFEKQQYYIYYISQFNKFRVNDFIKWDLKVTENVRNKINEDLKRVDLDSIIMGMPDLSTNDNQMLKDIGSFQLHYSLFQEAYRLSEKVKEQQNTEYRFFAGTPNYIRMQWLVKDYYRYLMYNFLMVDRYQESKEVLTLYVKSIMGSATTPDKGKDNNSTGNIHASKIGIFETFLMIKYMSEKDILNMFRQHEIDIIPMEDECNDYVKTVLNNLRLEKSLRCQNELWNCVAIIAYMCPNSELVEDTIDCISDQFSFVNYRTHKSIIIRFLNTCQENKRFRKRAEGVFKYDDYALGRFLKNLIWQAKDVHGSEIVDYSEIIQYVASILSNTYEEYYNESLQSILSKENNLIIARIYPYCDKKNQKLISDHLRKCKKDVSQKSCEIYSYMVMNHIIKPDKDYEQQIFDYLSAISKKDYDIFPTEYQDILAIMFNLYLNDLIVQTEIFKNILIGAEDDVLLFMSEKESFDYEKFNLEWLQKCNSKLLEDIAHNEVARYEISKKFAEEIEKGRVDSKLLKLYFKYFACIKDLE